MRISATMLVIVPMPKAIIATAMSRAPPAYRSRTASGISTTNTPAKNTPIAQISRNTGRICGVVNSTARPLTSSRPIEPEARPGPAWTPGGSR
jgi:hypothetical protein